MAGGNSLDYLMTGGKLRCPERERILPMSPAQVVVT